MAEEIPQNKEALAAIKILAELSGVDLNDQNIAIVTPKGNATAKMYNDSLEATIIPKGAVYIKSPRAPGIEIELIDPTKDSGVPKGAIYRITAYIRERDMISTLNGDVASVYVGPEGIILDGAGRRRASKLPAIEPE